jgi:hypothetical protein
MIILKYTVAITHVVSDVVLNISFLRNQTHAQIHQNAHSILGITQQTIKEAQYTEIFNAAKNKLLKVIFYLIILEIRLQM